MVDTGTAVRAAAHLATWPAPTCKLASLRKFHPCMPPCCCIPSRRAGVQPCIARRVCAACLQHLRCRAPLRRCGRGLSGSLWSATLRGAWRGTRWIAWRWRSMQYRCGVQHVPAAQWLIQDTVLARPPSTHAMRRVGTQPTLLGSTWAVRSPLIAWLAQPGSGCQLKKPTHLRRRAALRRRRWWRSAHASYSQCSKRRTHSSPLTDGPRSALCQNLCQNCTISRRPKRAARCPAPPMYPSLYIHVIMSVPPSAWLAVRLLRVPISTCFTELCACVVPSFILPAFFYV